MYESKNCQKVTECSITYVSLQFFKKKQIDPPSCPIVPFTLIHLIY